MENQWGYMNPETYVTKPKQVKGLGMLETKSSESEESDSDEQKAQVSLINDDSSFYDSYY